MRDQNCTFLSGFVYFLVIFPKWVFVKCEIPYAKPAQKIAFNLPKVAVKSRKKVSRQSRIPRAKIAFYFGGSRLFSKKITILMVAKPWDSASEKPAAKKWDFERVGCFAPTADPWLPRQKKGEERPSCLKAGRSD